MNDSKSFLHCLRAQIYPDEYAQERIDSLKRFCLKYGIQNVILIFNGEEHNVGHIEDDELLPWLEVMEKAKEEFASSGISVSLNPWMEMGHLDRGRKLHPGQHFQTMVDRFGNASELVACPLDKEWKSYYLHQLSTYVSALKPEVLWIEDDYRLHNHPPLDWGGCFCPLHMEAYEKKLGKKESREEFVSALSKSEPSPERKAWLDVSWDTLNDLAKEIGETVAKSSPSTHVGLMSSMPWQHAMEARDWKALHASLSSDGIAIDRIHLPAYREEASKKYYFDFNRISMVNRAFLGDECLIYPELENSSFSVFVKDKKFLAFQLESALPLGISGMTYNIFAHCGNGAQEEFGYGDEIAALTPYLNAVKDLNLLPSQTRGLVFPADEKTVYHTHEEGFLNLIPKDFDPVGYFSSMGFSYHVSLEKKFDGDVVVLTGNNVWNFTPYELVDLFCDNFVLVDGKAAFILYQRGLSALILAKSVELRGEFHQTDAFEMPQEGVAVDGFHHLKATSQRRAGPYYALEYAEGVEVVSFLYDARMNKTGNGVAISSHFMVYPYEIHGTEDTAFFMPLRRYLFQTYLLPHMQKPFIQSDSDGVYAYLYEQKGRYVALFVNANYCSYDALAFQARNLHPTSIKAICKDGTTHEVRFGIEQGKIRVETPLNYLSTATLLIEE